MPCAHGGGDAAPCVDQARGGGAARRGDAMSQFAAGHYASDHFRINCYKWVVFLVAASWRGSAHP